LTTSLPGPEIEPAARGAVERGDVVLVERRRRERALRDVVEDVPSD
jgi:hypothetical protein